MDESEPYHSVFLLLTQVDITTYLLELLILILLLAASGLVSGSEVAFFSISETEIDECKTSKSIAERRLAYLCRDKNTLLATILVLNNLVNVAIVVLSTYVTWQLYGRDAEGWAVVSLTVFVTTAIVFFGEVVPKVFAQERSRAFAKFTANGIFIAQKLLIPLTFFLTRIGSWIRRKFSSDYIIPSITLNQFSKVLERTLEQEVEEPSTQEILRSIVNFGSTTVKQLMRPRPDIFAIEEKTEFAELIELVKDQGYSRIPIYRETLDDILGIFYVKDLLEHLKPEDGVNSVDFAWQTLIRSDDNVLWVSENVRANALFKKFKENQVHMAIVIDEYGGTQGLVTLEDVIEEIVGEIEDEFDEVTKDDILITPIENDCHLVDGKISLHDLCKHFNLDQDYFDADKGNAESLGGLLFELFEEMPSVSEYKDYRDFRFEVTEADEKRIAQVMVMPLEKLESD
ncbi:MAG: gliding motility-associated protein GldE [Bacteroidota bacterium]